MTLRFPPAAGRRMLASGAAILSLCAAVQGEEQPSGGAAGGWIRCEIRITSNGGLTEYAGLAWAARRVEGEYDLTVSSRGPGGVSNTVQRGRFVLEPHRQSVLSRVQVMAGRTGTVQARLSIHSNGRELCQFTS
ncbi:hypothetical protein LV780_17750 [Cereibacter azotoformans]|nr:curli-like amyloid fiber formation chaperone CsgH [Cereibacter azotoformans]AXQ95568.1 hypothetical protein D0Z66_17520 [Cereibacter sphaeroides]UIJ32187.1 hypothetical protein LV780_17750 [Cereibacter azotoformans]